ARGIDLRRARERLQELGLTHLVHRGRAVATHLDLFQVALGRQAEQALRDLWLACADRERDVDRRERLVGARQALRPGEPLLPVDLGARLAAAPSKGTLPTRMASLEAHRDLFSFRSIPAGPPPG